LVGIRLLLTLLLAASAAVLAGEAAPPKEEEKPANPFGETKSARADALPGKLVLSDGKELRGKLYLTRDKQLELFDTKRQEWNKLDLKELSKLEISVEKEETVKEWRWKEAGSDVKVDTGRTKVDRTYKCAATKADGKKIEGHLRGTVIFVKESEDADPKRFFLLWNSPGDFDQKPEDLVYVKAVVLGEEAARPPKSDKSDQSDKSDRPDQAAPAKVSLILVDAGERKIAVIKAVREITGLGLKEAKELVDGAPKPVKAGLARAEAEELQKKLEAAGAKVKIEQP
jgi:ribosomal protein L7/L12